jgi:hypothetical protein
MRYKASTVLGNIYNYHNINKFIIFFKYIIMTRYTKDAHGNYVIRGKKYEILCGSRAQVVHGTAYKTSGGLIKDKLLQNKNGRIVSRKKHNTAKKEKRLVKAGYGTKKGHFGAVKISKSRSRRHNKRGGGIADNAASVPANLDSKGGNLGNAQLQLQATSMGGSRRRRSRHGGYTMSPAAFTGGRRRRGRGRRGGATAAAPAAPAAPNTVLAAGTNALKLAASGITTAATTGATGALGLVGK